MLVDVEGAQGFLRRRIDGRTQNVASLYHHDDDSWFVACGATRSGGYRRSATGLPGESLPDVVSKAISQLDDPFGPPPSLANELASRLGAVLSALLPRVRGRPGGEPRPRAPKRHDLPVHRHDADGVSFDWAPVFACERHADLHRAFAIARAELELRLTVAPTDSSRRKLKAARFEASLGTFLLWETNHDEGAGLQLHLARARKGRLDTPSW